MPPRTANGSHTSSRVVKPHAPLSLSDSTWAMAQSNLPFEMKSSALLELGL